MSFFKRPRTDRRALERDRLRLAEQREKLARREPGGAPDRPIEVATASLVELRAEGLHCARCEAETRAIEHEARTVDGIPLREVTCRCKQCGAERSVWLRVLTALPN